MLWMPIPQLLPAIEYLHKAVGYLKWFNRQLNKAFLFLTYHNWVFPEPELPHNSVREPKEIPPAK